VRIGVFGGSFDPVHAGHLAAARAVLDRLKLDQVRFIPAALQPLKRGHHASPSARADMLDVAVQGEPRFVVDRRELGRPGPSYMIDTLRALRADFPKDQLFLMLGADAARDLSAWHDVKGIPALARLVVHARPGANVADLPWAADRVEVALPDIAATSVRDAVRAGQPIEALVPKGVAEYIAAHGLYMTEGAC
jgi:nicotinate-nucleotide adenylyltransferase